MFFCCLGNKEKKGANSLDSSRSDKSSTKGSDYQSCKRQKEITKSVIEQTSSITKDICDFGCQYSLQSNHSLEIKSHLLTKSVSQLSSVQSVFSIKWRRRFRRYEKTPSMLRTMLNTIANLFKSSKKKPKACQKNNKKNLLVIHVPKKYSNTSTVDTVSTTHNAKIEKPLIIRDESSIEPLNAKHKANAKPPDKLCRPGEVLVKNST